MRTPILLAALALAMSAPAVHAQNTVKGGPETPSPSKCAGPDGKDAVAAACKGAGPAPSVGSTSTSTSTSAGAGPVYQLDSKGVCRDARGKKVKAVNCKS